MAIKENVLPLAQDSGSGYIRTVSSGGVSQRTAFDTVKGAITADMDEAIADEVDAREAADNQLQTEIDGKVDKVTGKGLSTNDFTNTLKSKLDGIEAGAEVNPTIDDALSDESENAVQNKVITGEIADLKEEINDKPNWTVGSAEQIVSDEASQTDVTPYTFRRSGGGLIPFSFTREELAKVVGGTVAWNQKAGASFRPAQTQGGITYTPNNDGTFTLNGTATMSDWWSVTPSPLTNNTVVGHKYIYWDANHQGSQNTFGLTMYSTAAKAYGNEAKIFEATTTSQGVGYWYQNGAVINNAVLKPVCVDLTAMFGTPIADKAYTLEQSTPGSGIAWLRSYGFLTEDYYEYCQPRLESVRVSGHETVGFNQWDEEWELGTIDNSGNDYPSTTRIRSKGYTSVLPSTTYYLKSSLSTQLFYYDADKTFISAQFKTDATFTTPNNAYYIRLSFNSDYGTTYNHDICINIDKPTGTPKNGDYVPYEKHSYALDSDLVLRGILKLDSNNKLYYDGDVYASDGGVVRKYAVVDMGTLNWVYYTDSGGYFGVIPTGLSPQAKPTSANVVANIEVSKGYTPRMTNEVYGSRAIDLSIGIHSNGALLLQDTSYGEDASALKTSLSGTYLVYELATPTTETADPYTAVQICDSDGTEEFVDALVEAGTRDVAIPAGTETTYFEDMAGKLAELPPIPSAPSANGTYTLQAVVSSGAVTYSWTS